MTTLLMKLRTELHTINSTENDMYTWVREFRDDNERPDPEFMEKLDKMLEGRHDETPYLTSHRGACSRRNRTVLLIRHNTDHIKRCEDCDGWEWEDDVQYAYDENALCQQCIDNYRWSDARDTYVSEEDYYDEQDEDESEQDEYINNYDENVLDHLNMQTSDKDRVEINPLYMGVELEVERRRDCPDDIGYEVYSCFTKDNDNQFAMLKADGSLSNGFEIVTAPATLNAHRESWDKFLTSDAIKHLKSWNTDTTGMHIHIARNHLTQLDIGKLLVFINDTNNEDFVNHIAGRNSSQWARKSDKKVSDAVRSSEKYEAVNMSHRNTIEFRIFKGNLAKNGLFRIMEFVHALVCFSKTTSLSKLSWSDFISYMELPQNRSEYKVFYGWLTRKSYCIGKPSRSIDWTDEQSSQKEIA